MENLTIQAFLQREWVDIAQISFPRSDENNWRITELHYQSDYAIEYLECDDNHGRNTAFMRYQGEIKLAPIYDFAPMKADPKGIPRSTKWAPTLETGGEYHFPAIAQALADLVEPDTLLAALQHTARQLYGLENRLRQRGVPEQIMSMPSIGFKFIADKLHRWGLL